MRQAVHSFAEHVLQVFHQKHPVSSLSLVAQAILGTLPAELQMQGTIDLDDCEVTSLAPAARASLWGRRIAALPQEPWRALSPLMRAAPQVRETYRHVARAEDPDAAQACAFESLE